MEPLTPERARSSPSAARPTRHESFEAGRARRKLLPRSAHAELAAPDAARDPLAIMARQDDTRLAELVPIRYGRMVPTAFTFLRGAAAVMAHDLAAAPHSGLLVQLCGDAHLSNFGAYAGPDRRLVFDLNDFDETLPGPFEWDVKRLTASLVVSARDNEFPDETGPAAAAEAVRSYREAMARFAQIPTMDAWYQRTEADSIKDMTGESEDMQRRVTRAVKKAKRRTSMQAFEKLTAVENGRRRIVADPPLVIPLDEDELPGITRRVVAAFDEYRMSLAGDRRHLLDKFRFIDIAHKIVGVGSVGTRCLIVLFEDDSGAPLFLQVKEADRSVLEEYLPASRYRNHGRRVVEGQRLMQATSDIFLGWSHDAEGDVDFYFRQLRDMKVSGDIASFLPETHLRYGALCGAVMARAHARSGDAAAIAGYLGENDRFDAAIARWAVAYAERTERDHKLLTDAVADGRVDAVVGV